MGWFWSSQQAVLPPTRQSTPAPKDPTRSPTPPSSTSKATRPESNDPAVDDFFAMLRAEFSEDQDDKPAPPPQPTASRAQTRSWSVQSPPPPPSSTTTSKSSRHEQTPSPSHNTNSTTSTADPDNDQDTEPQPILPPLADSLLPTTMSCRQAFDAAYYCQTPGGQFTSVYRYGTVLPCSQHWEDFWFCMRVKGYGGEAKERAVRDYYRKKEWERYYQEGKPSSEDVWEEREERVEVGRAFDGNLR